MIRATGVTRTYGGRTLFEGVDWFLGERDRCGLVGPNGSGKSSWLKILAGVEAPDEGRIEMPKGQRLGYLPQTGYYRGTESVWAEARGAFAEVLALHDEKSALERDLERGGLAPAEAEAILHKIDALEEEYRRRGGYDIDRQVDLVLRGLGFAPAEFEKPTPLLSGGWQMRVALARILLQRPEVLLLDEPTNFLDIEAREWLEGFLREYPGGVLLVSHDRYFLDVTVNRITDIMQKRMTDYACNYSQFLEERERRYEDARKAYERQQEEIKRVELFINRFRAKNTKATQVQSRIKMLEKMDRLEMPPPPAKAIRFQFPQPDRTGRVVLELSGVRKAYDDLVVFSGVDLMLERGQKVALVGPNGAGKSTLMRILAGTEPFEGERREGHKVSSDHFAQDAADQLPGDRTILDYAQSLCPMNYIPKLRGLLGAFLFTGDDVDKRIGVLSGGERSRLALAMMLMEPSNVILLDEPTNHLDIAAQEVLLHALREFEGTCVFVSHDRAFIEGLATRVIEVGGGRLLDHPGDYESFLYKKGLLAQPSPADNGRPVPAATPKPDAAPDPKSKKSNAKRLRELEQEIATLEERKEKLEALLARDDFYRDAEKSNFYLTEYRELTQKLEATMEEWVLASE
ncbi:MAG: ABC-F family ATP-binding cassette domain-containing protein [Candidatus Eisenbacteria bacterium]|nr:ABC-F family ATP-binding cassette domain-containing protein [Candidatus Eisenbacteria bacterium]